MQRTEEWDWPPRRRRGYYRTYRTLDVHQPSSWDWSIRKKIIDIGWKTMIAVIKVVLTIALTAMAAGASWLIVTVLTL
jgi:hypothetical protein